MDHYFTWFMVKRGIWLSALLLALLYFAGTEETNIFKVIWYSITIATIAVLLASLVRSIILAIKRFIARQQMRRRVERTGPEVQRGRYTPPSRRPLVLKDIQLLIESGPRSHSNKKLGLLVNPTKDHTIRPVVVIVVNDLGLVGRQIPLKFSLTDPREHTHFETLFTLTFKPGENRIIPRDFLRISRKLLHGTWRIHLWAGDRLWGIKDFSLTSVTLAKIAGKLGEDMEIRADAAEDAEKLEGADPEDVLKGIIE